MKNLSAGDKVAVVARYSVDDKRFGGDKYYRLLYPCVITSYKQFLEDDGEITYSININCEEYVDFESGSHVAVFSDLKNAFEYLEQKTKEEAK